MLAEWGRNTEKSPSTLGFYLLGGEAVLFLYFPKLIAVLLSLLTFSYLKPNAMIFLEEVVRRCSVKKVFLKISQNSQKIHRP